MSGLSKAKHLLQLAGEQSSEKRRQLLREITDIFLVDPEGYSDTEQECFGDIISHIALSLDAQTRADLAERLADMKAAPRKVIRQLATDDIVVASPILERNPSLSDVDLIEIVRSSGGAHQASVARRDGLSVCVSDVLVEDGQAEAVQALLENESANIARVTMQRAISRSANDPRLQAPLVARCDMPVEMLQDMFWFVSPALRRQIVQVISKVDPSTLGKLKIEADLDSRAAPRKEDPLHVRAREYVDRMQKGGWLNRALLVDLLRRKSIPELIVGFARLVKVPETTALRILHDRSGEGLVIACRAGDFDRSTFATFVKMGMPGCPRSDAEFKDMLEMFDKTTIETAQRVMRFWRIRQTNLVVVNNGDGKA